MSDIYLDYGSDLQIASSGDFETVTGSTLTQQRIIRRLLTILKTYIEHPEYGAGLAGYVGRLMSPDVIDEIIGKVKAQMYLEDAVSKIKPPVITIQPDQTIINNLNVGITYYQSDTLKPFYLSFSVS